MARPPNILWFCTDQQPLANRPAIAANLPLQARLAREGTRFTRAFTVLPICSPARASMLTGLYPSAHGLTENDGRFGGRAELDLSDWLFTRDLADAGYRCAWFGKWHLGQKRTAADFGFEGVSLPGYGYPYGCDAYREYLDEVGLKLPSMTVELPGESGIAAGTRMSLADRSDWPDFEAGTGILDGPATQHEAFFVAHLAAQWLETAKDAPFFMRVDPWGPHPPYIVAPPFSGSIAEVGDPRSPNIAHDLENRPQHHRDYRDSWRHLRLDEEGWRLMAQRSLEQATLVEAALLRVLDALDRLGLSQDTLVVMTADHGDAVASNGGVANKGGLLVEETVRIPLLVSGPGLPRGRECERIVSNLDVAPTLLELAELTRPDALHGASLLPLLQKTPDPWRRSAMIQHYGLHTPVLQRAWREERWKLVLQEDGFRELYDLAADPCEMVNLAGHPEQDDRIRGMVAALTKEMQRIGDDGGAQRRLLGHARTASAG